MAPATLRVTDDVLPRPPFLTTTRAVMTTILLVIGFPKAVLAYHGKGVAPTVFDWVLCGACIAVLSKYYWADLFEVAGSTLLRLQRDYAFVPILCTRLIVSGMSTFTLGAQLNAYPCYAASLTALVAAFPLLVGFRFMYTSGRLLSLPVTLKFHGSIIPSDPNASWIRVVWFYLAPLLSTPAMIFLYFTVRFFGAFEATS
ncbi:hypothetical protein FA95DRAFT_1604633 [Auriscalpium vulgare]|uniref:Uncharacterized protein n=1 Tax=Auriscalpium vulgare TaxID=40419 RepID=A0ACB8RYE9_9AGAM|nr:hypothetical protein FA95DRAFT_1604633 [Auriscalpium vulgare]